LIEEFTKNIICTDSYDCSDKIIDKLKLGFPNLKLRAENKTDTVNGSLTIRHTPNDHKIIIEIYDTNEDPNSEHESTLKRPTIMPTKARIKSALA